MLDFLKKHNKDTKTYMKFENGKVVTVTVPKKKKPYAKAEPSSIDKVLDSAENEPSLEEFDLPPIIEDTIEEPERKPKLNIPLLKKVVAGVIIVVAIFIVYDFCKTFFFDTVPTPDAPQTNTQTDAKSNNQSGSQTDVQDETPDVAPQNPSHEGFEIIRVIDSLLVDETNAEIAKINDYLDNKANMASVKNAVAEHTKVKQNLYISLVSNKSLFENEDMIELYEATENRILNSLAFTKNISVSIGDRVKMRAAIADFRDNENELKEKEISELLKTFDKKGIKYQVRPETNEITYTLE